MEPEVPLASRRAAMNEQDRQMGEPSHKPSMTQSECAIGEQTIRNG
jgi:hypothetical protein